jgi:anti-anti-sigma factor
MGGQVDDIMKTRVRRGVGVSVLAVSGEIDLSVVEALDAAIERTINAADKSVLIDLTGVEYLDSCGCQALVRGAERARARGIEFRISQASGFAQRVLELTGLSDALIASPSCSA